MIGAVAHILSLLLLFGSIMAQAAVFGHARQYVPIWPIVLYAGAMIAIFQVSSLNAFAGPVRRIGYVVMAALWIAATVVAEAMIRLGYTSPSETFMLVRCLMHLGWFFVCLVAIASKGKPSNSVLQPTRACGPRG